eukprot:6919972-Prymnesium_polylepis.1
MHSGRRAEAAHLFRPKLAPNLKMLSSARQRAGAFDTQSIVSQRSVDWLGGGPPQWHTRTSWACHSG